MNSVFLSLLLAFRISALPVEIQPRALGSLVADTFLSSQEQTFKSSALPSSPFNGIGSGLVREASGAGGGGLGGGLSTSNVLSSQASSSSSSSTVINSFAGIGSQLSQFQSMFASGSITANIAVQQMTQVATSFQLALSQAPTCLSCFTEETFTSTVGGVFQQFTQVMTTMQSTFTTAFPQIRAPFQGIQGCFNTFLSSISSNGIAVNSIIPPNLPAILGGVIHTF